MPPSRCLSPSALLRLSLALALASALCLFMGCEEPGMAANTTRKTPVNAVPPGLTLEAMAGQMIMTGFRGNGADPASGDLAEVLADIRSGRVGGVILFDRDILSKASGRNIVSLEQTRELTARLHAAAPLPLFVAVDQEGGRVRRFTEEHDVAYTPPARELGLGPPMATYDEALRLGRTLSSAGINLDFAPALDVDINPHSPAIGALGRSFSADAGIVAAHGGAFAKGLTDGGVLACYKHFPGHGSAADDSHNGLADISSTWQPAELAPYRALLGAQPPAMVMVGHVLLRQKTGELPASLSSKAVSGMLRRELGWKGVVITDDLQMRAIAGQYNTRECIRLAVMAGVDILLFGNNLTHDPAQGSKVHAVLMDLVHSGEIPPQRIRQSYHRIMKLKARLRQQ